MKTKNSDAVVKFFIDLSNKNAIKGVADLDKKSDALSKKFNQAGKTLTIGLTTPLVAFGTYAVKTATDFDRASNQIQAGLGLSTDKAKEFDNVLREMYTANYGESYEDLANKISYVAQATGEVDPSKIKNLTENAITLEETFGSDFNETIRGVTNLMTHFGISSEEAFDLFAKGSQLGLDYTAELGDNIAEYGGNFQQAGYSATEYFQLLSNGTKNGAYNLDKVNDSINEIKNRLGDGTIKENLSMFSSETKTIFKSWQNGEGTMKDVINSIVSDIANCENEQKQLTMAATAFGTMGEDANLKVVTSLTTVGDEFNNVKGSMETLKEVKYDDLGSMLESLGRQFSDIALDVGNELMPTIQSFIGKIQELVNWFKNLDPETKTMIGNIAKIAVVVGPALIIFSKLINTTKEIASAFKFLSSKGSKAIEMIKSFGGHIKNGLGTIAKFTKSLGKMTLEFGKSAIQAGIATVKFIAQKAAMLASVVATNAMAAAQAALNFIMSLNPITLIIIAIVALIAILVVLWNKCEWFRDGVMTVINAIWGAIQVAIDFIVNLFTTLFNIIWGLIQAYVNFWITVWTTVFNVVSTVLTSIWNVIQSVFNFIWGIISGVINSIISAFQTVANVVKSVFNSVKNAISSIFSGIVNIIKAPINGLIGLVNGVIKGLNKIKLPDWVPGIGGKGINIPLIPKLDTGTNYIAREGLAYLHEGEAVVPKKYNPAIGGYGNYQPNITIIADMDVNKFGKAFVRDVKTFSGGSKNSYNYGGSK